MVSERLSTHTQTSSEAPQHKSPLDAASANGIAPICCLSSRLSRVDMRASSTYTDGTLRCAANFKPKVKLKYQGYFTVDAAPSRSAVRMELAVIATDSILVSFVLRIDIPDRPDAISAERRRPGRREPPKHAIGDDGQESFDSTRSLKGETLGISQSLSRQWVGALFTV